MSNRIRYICSWQSRVMTPYTKLGPTRRCSGWWLVKITWWFLEHFETLPEQTCEFALGCWENNWHITRASQRIEYSLKKEESKGRKALEDLAGRASLVCCSDIRSADKAWDIDWQEAFEHSHNMTHMHQNCRRQTPIVCNQKSRGSITRLKRFFYKVCQVCLWPDAVLMLRIKKWI